MFGFWPVIVDAQFCYEMRCPSLFVMAGCVDSTCVLTGRDSPIHLFAHLGDGREGFVATVSKH